ncbi:hypothetical protein PS639_04612 [Pseudomonas fluorescens]|nr:hypothetical protein PS639_04612 [Pseudomonas fluorescens]
MMLRFQACAVRLPLLLLGHFASPLFIVEPAKYINLALIHTMLDQEIDLFHNL